MKGGYITDSTHVRSQVVHLVDPPGSDQAAVESAKVEKLEFMGWAWLVFGVLDVDPTYPITLVYQALYQVVPDKTPCSSY
jgi:hypothetical protein